MLKSFDSNRVGQQTDSKNIVEGQSKPVKQTNANAALSTYFLQLTENDEKLASLDLQQSSEEALAIDENLRVAEQLLKQANDKALLEETDDKCLVETDACENIAGNHKK